MMTDKQKIAELEKKMQKLEDVLVGTDDDVRFKAKVRNNVVGITASNGLPYVITANGIRYQITNVTKLN